jgi:hypothetical protein
MLNGRRAICWEPTGEEMDFSGLSTRNCIMKSRASMSWKKSFSASSGKGGFNILASSGYEWLAASTTPGPRLTKTGPLWTEQSHTIWQLIKVALIEVATSPSKIQEDPLWQLSAWNRIFREKCKIRACAIDAWSYSSVSWNIRLYLPLSMAFNCWMAAVWRVGETMQGYGMDLLIRKGLLIPYRPHCWCIFCMFHHSGHRKRGIAHRETMTVIHGSLVRM